MSELYPKRLSQAFNLLLLLLHSIPLYYQLHQLSDPPGMNGYFYLKQIETLAKQGRFYFSDHSLAFLPLAFLQRILGNSLLTFQLSLALTFGFFLLGAFYFIDSINQSKNHTSAQLKIWEEITVKTLLSFSIVSSSFFTEFSLNFYKNFFAITLVLWSSSFQIQKRYWTSLFIFVLAFLTHKSVTLFGGLYLAAQFLEILKETFKSKTISRQTMIVLFLSFLCSIFFGSIFLIHFPKASHFLEYLTTIWQSPIPRLSWWKHVLLQEGTRGIESLAFILILTLYLIQRHSLLQSHRKIGDTVVLFSAIAIHPFQNADESALGYRLVLMLPAALLPLAGTLMIQRQRGNHLLRAMNIIPYILILYFSHPSLGFRPSLVDIQIKPFSKLYSGVSRITALVDKEDYLISHHGLEFYVDYITGIRSRSFVAEPAFKNEIYRIAFVPQGRLGDGPVMNELNQAKILDIDSNYFLIKEKDWKRIAEHYHIPNSWKNPTGRRPPHVYE